MQRAQGKQTLQGVTAPTRRLRGSKSFSRGRGGLGSRDAVSAVVSPFRMSYESLGQCFLFWFRQSLGCGSGCFWPNKAACEPTSSPLCARSGGVCVCLLQEGGCETS